MLSTDGSSHTLVSDVNVYKFTPCVFKRTGWHKKNGNFWKTQQKLKKIQEKIIIDRNWTIKTCLLRDSNPNYQCLKLRPVDGVLLHVCILSLPLRISKVPVLLCHPVCVSCSAECDRVAFCRACNVHCTCIKIKKTNSVTTVTVSWRQKQKRFPKRRVRLRTYQHPLK